MMKADRLIAKWLDHQKNTRRVTPESLGVYRVYLDRLRVFLQRRPKVLTADLIYGWLGGLTQEGLGECAVYDAFKTVRAMCRWGNFTGHLRRDPTHGMRPPIVHKKLLPYPTKVEFVRVYKAIRRSGRKHALRDATIEAVLYYPALRISECLRLRPRDVDLKSRILRGLGKGSVPFEVSIHRTLARRLRVWMKRRPQEAEYLFPSQANGSEEYGRLDRQRYERALRETYLPLAGLEGAKFTPHSFRRGSAQAMKREVRAPLVAIQKHLRHVNLNTTAGYVPETPEEVRHWSDQI